MSCLKKLLILLGFVLIQNTPLQASEDTYLRDYCSGYLEEVYWTLDPLEEEPTRGEIIQFFEGAFPNARDLNFDLYYSSQERQFLENLEGADLSSYNKVNYPNFEVILLDAYLNVMLQGGKDYCPAFWDDCSEQSLQTFFLAAEDFSQSWQGEESVLSFLQTDFSQNQCFTLLQTDIDQQSFTQKLNLLIEKLVE